MDQDLYISPGLIIPGRELKWTFSRSSGPGGQNVNKVETAVELAWNFNQSQSIGPHKKQRIRSLYQSLIVNGTLRISVSEHRSQFQNRQLALKRMSGLVRAGLKAPPPVRKPTKPTRNSERKRLVAKKQRGAIKRARQSRHCLDD